MKQDLIMFAPALQVIRLLRGKGVSQNPVYVSGCIARGVSYDLPCAITQE